MPAGRSVGLATRHARAGEFETGMDQYAQIHARIVVAALSIKASLTALQSAERALRHGG
jgi:hypothetical protein